MSRAESESEAPPSSNPDRRPWDLYTPRNRRAFLSVLFLVGVSSYVDKNIIGVLLEPIKLEFHVSDTALGLLSGLSFALFYVTLGIPVARWADRGDRKWVITLSLAVWSLMTALCGLVGTFWQLAAARFGVGAGEAGALPPSQSLLADYFPPAKRAQAIGIFMMSASAGYAIALILGGFVAHVYGWRAVFLMVGIFGIALTPLTHFVLKEPRRELLKSAVRPASGESMLDALRVLFAKPAYRNLLAATMVYFIMCYGALVFIVSLMIRVHGMNVAQAGTAFGTISAVGGLIGSIGGGVLADRLAARDLTRLARVGGLLMFAAIPFYELALWSSSLTVMVCLLVVGTMVLNAVVPPAYSALHVVCGSKRRALAMALVFFFANLIGLGLGPFIAGALSDRFAVVHGSADGLRYALMVVMSVLLPAGWLMLRAARYMHQDAED